MPLTPEMARLGGIPPQGTTTPALHLACGISSRHSSQKEPSRFDAGAASNDQANNFIVRCCCTTVKESPFRDRVRVLLANPVAGAQFLGGVLVMELESSSAGPGASAGDPALRPLPVLLPPEHS